MAFMHLIPIQKLRRWLMRKLIPIMITLFTSLSFASGIVQTSSVYQGKRFVGTGFVVSYKNRGNDLCSNIHPRYDNCRYFVITSAHHFSGEDKMICHEKTCYDIKNTIINVKDDVAISELSTTVRNDDNFKFFASYFKDKLLVNVIRETNTFTKDPILEYKFFGQREIMPMLQVGDIAESVDHFQPPVVPLPSWVGQETVNYQQVSLPLIEKENIIRAKQLFLSKNWMLPSGIRPGQSGAPLLIATGHQYEPHVILGHTLKFNKHSTQSIFSNEEKILKTLNKMIKGKRIDNEFLDRAFNWNYSLKNQMFYRHTSDFHFVEYPLFNSAGEETLLSINDKDQGEVDLFKLETQVLIDLPAHLKKKPENSLEKVITDLELFKDSKGIKAIKGVDKKPQADIKGIQFRSGNGTYGDGGDELSETESNHTFQDVNDGIMIDGQRVSEIKIRHRRKDYFIKASFESLNFFENDIISFHTADRLKKQIDLFFQKDKTSKRKCKSQRSIRFCLETEVSDQTIMFHYSINDLKDSIIISHSEMKKNDYKTVISNQDLSIDLSGLFTLNLDHATTLDGESLREILEAMKYSVVISIRDGRDKMNSFPILFKQTLE